MYTIKANMSTQAQYPRDIVQRCKNHPRGITRTSTNLREKAGEQNNKVTLLEVEAPDSTEYYDAVAITNFAITQEVSTDVGQLCAYVSLLQPSAHIHMDADIIDTEKETVVAQFSCKDIENANYLDLKEDFQLDPGLNIANLEAVVHATWSDNGVEDTVSVLMPVSSMGIPVKYTHSRPKKESPAIIVGNPEGPMPPQKQYPPIPDHIVLALVRYPEDMSTVDYMCGFGRNPGNNVPMFGVPGQGNIIGPVGSVPLMDQISAECVVGPQQGGGMTVAASTYRTSDGTIKFTASGNVLTYDMECSWGCPYMGPQYWQKVNYDYDLTINYAYSYQGRTYYMNSRITSLNGDFMYQTLPLSVMYGCLVKDTYITMADRSKKRIDQICIGDRVMGIDGAPKEVINTWRGTEEDAIVHVITEQEKEIKMTTSHPVETARGLVRAIDLQEGDKLIGENHEWLEIREICRESYHDQVYNLDLGYSDAPGHEQQHLMLADGIWVGDNYLQNHMEDMICMEQSQA